MIKLLVIEDEKVLAENIKEIIADLGEVTLCFDGEEGLYEAQSKIYDLILLDLMLPKIVVIKCSLNYAKKIFKHLS